MADEFEFYKVTVYSKNVPLGEYSFYLTAGEVPSNKTQDARVVAALLRDLDIRTFENLKTQSEREARSINPAAAPSIGLMAALDKMPKQSLDPVLTSGDRVLEVRLVD